MQTSFQPLVTIGFPVYQGEKFLEKSLPKICNQSYKNLEIIVIDDNSKDKSFEICKKIHSKFKNFKLILNKKNLGAWDNFKKILQKSKGEYFCWACQDDFFDEKFVEKQVKVFATDQNVVATVPSWDLIKSKKVILTFNYNNYTPPQNESKFSAALNVFRSRRINGIREKNNMFIHGLIKKNIFINIINSYNGIIVSERVIVFFLALYGKLFFIEEKLWKRTNREHISSRPDRINDPALNLIKKIKNPFLHNIKTMTIMTFRNRSLNLFKKVLSLSLIFIIILRRIKINVLTNLEPIIRRLKKIKVIK
tara:strand:+ start:1258 stop:2181 length:924 start_codon:yes stop_codon:yes gene_type:complete